MSLSERHASDSHRRPLLLLFHFFSLCQLLLSVVVLISFDDPLVPQTPYTLQLHNIPRPFPCLLPYPHASPGTRTLIYTNHSLFKLYTDFTRIAPPRKCNYLTFSTTSFRGFRLTHTLPYSNRKFLAKLNSYSDTLLLMHSRMQQYIFFESILSRSKFLFDVSIPKKLYFC